VLDDTVLFDLANLERRATASLRPKYSSDELCG
jgi:hypothetical protein